MNNFVIRLPNPFILKKIFENHRPTTDVFIKRINKEEFYVLHPRDIISGKNLEYVKILDELLGAVLPGNITGLKVLIKPNLLKPGDSLCVTSWQLIVASALLFKEKGAKVIVGDSPAFGSASHVLKGMGIYKYLKRTGISCKALSSPRKVRLPCGVDVSISGTALDMDIICSIPRLKAHCQMGITGAVKNLYGVVPGFRKALYHVLYGKEPSLFSRIIIEIGQQLPPSIGFMDATLCMHGTGPTGGIPLWLGVIASSTSLHALDAAFYQAIGATTETVPVWHESKKLGLPGAYLEDINFPWLSPNDIKEARDFMLPKKLEPITFSPIRFMKGRAKSLIKKLVKH